MMAIKRGHHKFDDHFVQVPNDWMRDKRLSYKARGILAELMTHRANWQTSVARMAQDGQDGRDAIANGIKELEKFGYITRRQLRLEDGTLSEAEWITQDPPSTDYPSTAKPATDKPHTKKNISKNNEVKEISAQQAALAFDEFWIHYPKKFQKGEAKVAFLKKYKEHAKEMIAGVKRMAADPNLPEKQFIPYPATWINRLGWEDEPYPVREKTPEELETERKAKAELERAERILKQRVEAEEAAARRAAAVEPPKCEHGLSIVRCIPCAKRLAGEQQQ